MLVFRSSFFRYISPARWQYLEAWQTLADEARRGRTLTAGEALALFGRPW